MLTTRTRLSVWMTPVALALAVLASSCGPATTQESTVRDEQQTANLPATAITPEPAAADDAGETSVDPVEAFNAAAVAPDDVPDPEAEADLTERNLKADVNLAIADVPLDQVIFDTFDGGSVSLLDATDAQVRGLLNAIPPIDDPVYMPGAQASWLVPDDLVLGFVASDGTAWAHPHRVLNFHEIVNTTFDGQPVAVTYCPLCGSGLVFDRRPNDLRHDGLVTFDNTSALYENDMVMVDRETNTYWWQVGGTGIVGNLTGTKLTLLPSMTTSWAAWFDVYPDTQVLSNDQGNGPAYQFDPFAGYETRLDAGRPSFPTSPEAFADKRLQPSTRVIGFDLDGDPAAVAVLSNEPVVVPIGTDGAVVVFLDGRGGGALFSPMVDGAAATFTYDDRGFVDSVTGSVWNAAGRAVSGPQAGEQLEALPSRSAFWFAWVSTLDGVPTRLFTPTGER